MTRRSTVVIGGALLAIAIAVFAGAPPLGLPDDPRDVAASLAGVAPGRAWAWKAFVAYRDTLRAAPCSSTRSATCRRISR